MNKNNVYVPSDFYNEIYNFLYDITSEYDMYEKYENCINLYIDYEFFLLDLLENKVTSNNMPYETKVIERLKEYKDKPEYADDIISAIYHLKNVIDDTMYCIDDNFY